METKPKYLSDGTLAMKGMKVIVIKEDRFYRNDLPIGYKGEITLLNGISKMDLKTNDNDCQINDYWTLLECLASFKS